MITIDRNTHRCFQKADVAVRPRAVLAPRLDEIPLGDNSCDLILCFDVLEHIMDYRAIIAEWHRVVRAHGDILIWWVPYYHPYGHHAENLIPLPWIHVIFSESAIIEACARVYDMPEYRPRLWDRDQDGNKRPNKFRALQKFQDLNRLTIRRFERMVTDVGFDFIRREYHPIASSSFARNLSSALIRFPLLRDFFSACVVYQLRKN